MQHFSSFPPTLLVHLLRSPGVAQNKYNPASVSIATIQAPTPSIGPLVCHSAQSCSLIPLHPQPLFGISVNVIRQHKHYQPKSHFSAYFFPNRSSQRSEGPRGRKLRSKISVTKVYLSTSFSQVKVLCAWPTASGFKNVNFQPREW